jgi:predicted Zn-dependent protease
MSPDIEKKLKNARQLTEAGNHDEARLCLLELLKEEPNNQIALLMLGGAYFSTGKLAEAEMVFERLILQSAGTGEFSIALFNTLWKMNRHEEAFEEIKRFMAHADQVEERETIEQYIVITNNISNNGAH